MKTDNMKTPVEINIESLNIQFGNCYSNTYCGGGAVAADEAEMDSEQQDEAVAEDAVTADADQAEDDDDDLSDVDKAFLRLLVGSLLQELK